MPDNSKRSKPKKKPNNAAAAKNKNEQPAAKETKLQEKTETATGEDAEANAAETPLFPTKPGSKRPDYGTNNTLELLEKIPEQVVNLKLDEVLTAVKTVDNLCDYSGCKTKTSLIGQDCNLCSKRFCFKHGLPEVHGCGEAIKKDERKKFLHPKPLKTVRQEQDLVKAKKKLQNKLHDMQFNRKQKTAGAPGTSGSGSGGGAGGSSRSNR